MSTLRDDKPLIFLVDNDTTIAAMLPMELTDLGYESRVALTGDEFRTEYLKLYIAPAYRSPIFLIDIAINGHETGWDLVDFIRKYDKDCLIFMFTGRVNKIVDKYNLRKHNANAMIYKPKDGAEILAEIKRYQTKGRGTDYDTAQAGMWNFTDRQMAMIAFNIAFVIALIWFVGHIDSKVDVAAHASGLNSVYIQQLREQFAEFKGEHKKEPQNVESNR